MATVRYFTDEDFNGRIVRGLHRMADIDVIRVQDVGLAGSPDDVVLEWAADQGRILLTHDSRSMPARVRDRVHRGAHVPGVFIINKRAAIGACIDELLLVAQCSEDHEWEGRIEYLPWR